MSNGRNKGSIEFDLLDAPMLVHALRVAACTAMLCGHRDAQKLLKQYQDLIQQYVPKEAAPFSEEAWAEMGLLLAEAKTFHVTILPKPWEADRTWWSEGYLAITVGGRTFLGNQRSDRAKRGDDAAAERLFHVVSAYAPLDCEGTWDSGKREN